MSRHSPAAFHLMSPAFLEDPYPFYRRLLEEDPVHAMGPGRWLLCRHSDVTAILTDDQRAVKVPERSLQAYAAGPFHDHNQATLLFKDPPDYQRVRSTVSGHFMPRSASEWAARVEGIVDTVLQDLEGRAEFDFMREFATRIPHQLIAEIMGLDAEEAARFQAWSRVTSEALEPIATPQQRAFADDAVTEFREFVRELIRRRMTEPPRRDLIGSIIEQWRGGRLSEAEALANIPFFYSSGSETTPDLLGNGLHLLLTHPESMAKVRDAPDLLDNALEESLRLHPPVHMIHRFVTADIPLRDGIVLERDSSVTLGLAAANRDPAQFTDPDRFDIHRPARANRHVTFGAGTRHCMGAFLSRLEGRLAMGVFLKRFPRLRLLAPPVKRRGLIFKGFAELRVGVE